MVIIQEILCLRLQIKDGGVVENISLNIQKIRRIALLIISDPNYFYHVFNHDYVEENIRVLNYEKKIGYSGIHIRKGKYRFD